MMESRRSPLPLLATALLAVALLLPAPARARSEGQTTACKSNLKNIGTALEMYSTDFQGLYPSRLQDVTPTYLKTLPTCPSGSPYYFYEVSPAHDHYTACCAGHVHSAVLGGPWDPAYTDREGLVERYPGPGLTADQQKAVRARQERIARQRLVRDLLSNPLFLLMGVVAVSISLVMTLSWLRGALSGDREGEA